MTAPVPAAVESVQSDSGSTNLTVNKPTGTASGDWLVIFASQRNNPAPTLTGPSGFTEIEQDVGNQTTIACWYKKAGASEPSTYTVTSNQSQEYCVACVRITGGDSSDALDVSGITTYASNGSPFTCPSVNTTVADCLILRYVSKRDGTTAFTSPGDHTELFNETSGGAQFTGCAGAYENFASTGACGSADFTFSGVSEGAAVTVAIKPTAAGGPSIAVFAHHYRQMANR